MGLFDFLRPPPPPHAHPELGPLRYVRGRWQGTVALGGSDRIPIHIPGARSGPDPAALRTAKRAPSWWVTSRNDVERELNEHYSAGHDATMPAVDQAGLWKHVVLSSVEVRPYRSTDELQVALRVAWDDEHTLGALIRDGQLVELNGSILEPG